MLNLPWIVLVIIAALLASLLTFVDNYVTDVLFDGKHAQAEKLVGGPVYAIIGIGILAYFQPSFESIWPILLLLASGIVAGFSSVPYYAGMAHEESTSALIFSQLIPIFSLVLAWVFLGQTIDGQHLFAFGVTMLAPIVVIASKDRRSKRTGLKAAVAFILYGLLSAVSSLVFVQGANMTSWDFLICTALFLIGRGIADMLMMAVQKKWRRHFYNEAKKHKAKIFIVIILNTVVWILVGILNKFAMLEADALALADVSYRAIELIATFFLGVVLSVLWPQFGREKLNKRSVRAHLIATAIATIGIILLAA